MCVAVFGLLLFILYIVQIEEPAPVAVVEDVVYIVDQVVVDSATQEVSSHPCTAVCLSFGPIGQNFTASVTEACARRPGAAASVSRRRRERRILLAGGGRRASRCTRLRQAKPLSACTCLVAIW